MFEFKKEILREVYELAKDKHTQDSINNKDKLTKERKVLDDYLNSLDFEDVKMIQTIMYLGRDKGYTTNNSSEETYRKNREYMDNVGWNDKGIEVEQIIQKLPLDEYLEEGFKILGIIL